MAAAGEAKVHHASHRLPAPSRVLLLGAPLLLGGSGAHAARTEAFCLAGDPVCVPTAHGLWLRGFPWPSRQQLLDFRRGVTDRH